MHAKIVGEEVPHAHIWLYADPGDEKAKNGKEDFVANVEKIRSVL